MSNNLQTVDKLAVSVAEAAELLSVSKPTVYSLLKRWEDPLPCFHIGQRTLISVDVLREWVSHQGGAVL